MKAISFSEVGEPLEVLRLQDVAEAAAKPGEALVKVDRRPIHPADLAFIRGRYRVRPEFPQSAGLEGVGTIVSVPAGIDLAVGARVAFRAVGSWADMASVPVERLIAVPDDIDNDDACQAALNPLTAWGLLDVSGVAPGDWVVLTAATSVVANLVAQLCTSRGIKSIGVVRGDVKSAIDNGRCATDVVLSASAPDLAERIKEVTAGGASALIDSVGGPGLATLLGALSPGARIIAYGVLDPAPAPITNAAVIYSNLTWLGFGIDRWLASLSGTEHAAATMGIWNLLRDDSLALPVASRFELADFQQALRVDASHGRIGKVLLI
jgi:NADPH:quinone reductase